MTYEISDTKTYIFSSKEELIQNYINNIKGLSVIEKKLLNAVILRMNYNNCVNIGSDVKLDLIVELKMSRASIFRALKGLLNKQLLLHLNTVELKKKFAIANNNTYIVDPAIFGKGNLNYTKKITTKVIHEFDFEKLEYSANIERRFFNMNMDKKYKELEE